MEINELEIKLRNKNFYPPHPMIREFTVIYTLKFCNKSRQIGFLSKNKKIFFAQKNCGYPAKKDGFDFFSLVKKGPISKGLLEEINSTNFKLENILSKQIDVHEVIESNPYCDFKKFPVITLRVEGRVITKP